MPPVHSPSVPSFRIRRRRVSPTTVGLFPECPDVISPKQVVQGLAPAADQLARGCNTADLTGDPKTVDRSSDSNRPATDCPPASTTPLGNQSRGEGPIRIGAANSSQRANARLVGIARLAAFSPPAETRRKSAEKPEYFLLPVKYILNQCDSKRVPFE